MTAVLEKKEGLLAQWASGRPVAGMSLLLGEAPRHVRLKRVHFSRTRPVQLEFVATLRSGLDVPVIAEHCHREAEAHAARVSASLMKSRNGQRAGLSAAAVVADREAGLVLRRPGLDERLPGLKLLHDRGAARAVLADLTGRDPGPVAVRLVAHRLGKRAVLRIALPGGPVFARLRTVKSGEGADRLARHRALWEALGREGHLRIPKPLGAAPDLGLALFGALPGQAPAFGPEDCRAIDRALETLRGLDPAGLPAHTEGDEARLLLGWFERCRDYMPALADAIGPKLHRLFAEMSVRPAVLRPCHRDLHEKQILIAQGIAGLLDFDTLSLADPALDPGNLLAHLFLAGREERSLNAAIGGPGVRLWRRAALFRLAMIRAFSSAPMAELRRLVDEASADDRD
ncbi:phosphotransferase [Ovoidimarina sediminis]|uniref:phosphotransferase n=1 Tax=Ovoidimarina sediminis TaxID=3079856 RepID=UPI00290CD8DC|nr:phosphotransferase [Rhodophyticola sp. MJ-SS7]MDU8943182.1 phosphotransferase [Rhodophyticola sp. MJ-SS7]